MGEEGGEPACWLDRVCPDCGALIEDGAGHRCAGTGSVREVQRVLGIGGVFFRANDPSALAAWYHEHLGVAPPPEAADGRPWVQEAGPTVFAPFPVATDYFGRADQQWMLNFRVRDLDAIRDQLRAAGASVDEATEVLDGIGRFGWAVDPEGNRFELWEPVD